VKIAITGASGLLGSFVTRFLADKNLPVTALVRQNSSMTSLTPLPAEVQVQQTDIFDLPALHQAFQQVDTVVHCAALVSFNPARRKEIFAVNVEGTGNVVNACLATGVKKIVHISSVAALGRAAGQREIDETTKWVESPLNSYYAESKYLAELEVFRGREEGLDVCMVNPSVILAQAPLHQSSAQLFKYVTSEKPFYVDGLINYVDVRDVGALILQLLHSPHGNGERYIASAGAVSFQEMFTKIATRLGKRPPFLRVSYPAAYAVAVAEELRANFFGTEPLISRQTAQLAKEDFLYLNNKARQQHNITFKTLDETLDWCCPFYARYHTTNKF
jgi:nucleoside-diphosphate-sugar epimerase